ncbi:MAG: F0F1 ATP synthase subunit delta [Actinomycetes bacterium]
MASSTRQALIVAKEAQSPLLATADLKFASELFAVSSALSESVQLRGILSDPSAESDAKSKLSTSIFGKAVSASTLKFLNNLFGLRWSSGRDLVEAIETLAIRAAASVAAKKKELDDVEAQIFAFRHAVDSDSELQFALANKAASDDAKSKLVKALLGKKVSDVAELLIRSAVLGAGNRRVYVVLEQFGKQVSEFAERLVATVSVAAPISKSQVEKLESVLAAKYHHPVRINLVIDPELIGGMRVQLAGDIIDGSLSNRLQKAKLQLA